MKMARQSMISATRPQSLCGKNNAKTAILSKKPSNLKVSDFPSQIAEMRGPYTLPWLPKCQKFREGVKLPSVLTICNY